MKTSEEEISENIEEMKNSRLSAKRILYSTSSDRNSCFGQQVYSSSLKGKTRQEKVRIKKLSKDCFHQKLGNRCLGYNAFPFWFRLMYLSSKI